MEGWLLKWTNFFSGWKERFFVLKGPLLYYYYTKNDKPRGRIHLGISTIICEENDSYIEINTGSNLFYIQTKNEEEKNSWLSALKKAKFEGEKQIRSNNSKLINIDNINDKGSSIDNEKLNFIITKLDMDNQSFDNLMLKNSMNLTEYKVLLQRYKEEVEQLKSLLNENNNEDINDDINDDNNSLNPINNIDIEPPKLKSKKKILNSNQKSNNSFRSYEVESIIHSDEEFFDLDEDINENINDDFNKDIKLKDTIINNNPLTGDLLKSKKHSSDSNLINLNNSNTKIPKSLFTNNPQKKKYYDPLYNYKRRTKLPIPKKEISINVWSFFKGAVGKDLNRFAVPVFFNEPISSLQKFVEFFQYVDLFNKAANENNPFLRIAYCACFCIGEFVIDNSRQTKFFNPLLFETYEYVDNEKDYRIYAEQVSHHPAISACYAEGNGWDFYSNTNAILKFLISGKLEINAIGKTYISFSKYNDNISFTKPKVVVRNLIFGTITIDVEGKFTVTNDNGDICEIDMIPCTSGIKGQLNGTIKDVSGNLIYNINGNWTECIYLEDVNTKKKEVIWTVIPALGKEYYYFQPYTCDLNNLTEEMKKNLPRTDSRFRPDQRMMENQEIDEAGEEKHRLEEKQRAAAKKMKKDGIIPQPLYFEETYDDISGELIYKYKGGYWEDRKNKKFDKFPDIF
jgi:hypothetical protein